MRKLFSILLLSFVASTFMFAQNVQNKYSVKNTDIYFSLDLNAPIGNFASSNYRLAQGADQYTQSGTFNPSLGATVGAEFPISNDFGIRPSISYCSFSGTHNVGNFDHPGMKYSDLRISSDLLYYINQSLDGDIYLLCSLGLNLEKLSVLRTGLTESFGSKRFSFGAGLGYAFGATKSFALEGSILKTMGGTPPCNTSFPDLSIAKISLLIKL